MTAVATADERAAVDTVLGPPDSVWEGGARGDMRLDGHVAFGGRQARARRHLLLPTLQALQSTVGWVSEGGLNYVCERLTVPPAEAYGVASFYALLALEPRPSRVIHACDDLACLVAGDLPARLEEKLGPENAGEEAVSWQRSPCLGHCEQAPAAFVQVAGGADRTVAPATVAGLLDDQALPPAPPSLWQERAELRLLRRVGAVDPDSLDQYRAEGGYQALRTALSIGPAGVIREVLDSRLVGRGGAAFPTGRKWQAVAAAPARPHFLICNADESEPGTFKDRVVMEWDPFAVIEAMTIAGTASGCELGYLYVRGEYPLAVDRLRAACSQARRRGLLGPDVMGSGLGFDIEIRLGAGAYICGEETALMNSIEGFRGEPRNKPPFPTEVGLFGKPTVVNNVETLVNVLEILRIGGPAFAEIGTAQSTGTKLFCVSGTMARPGLYEVPFGTTLGGLLDLAGGTSDLQAVLLGGAAGAFVTPDQLDLPLTFEATREAGVALGSGVVMAMDRSVDLAAVLRRIAGFFRDESCGQCVPCRVGTVRQEEALDRLLEGGDHRREVALIDEIAAVMRDASICGLGQTAAGAIQSAFRLELVGGDGDG